MGLSFSGDLNWAEAFTLVALFYLFFNKRPLIVVNKTEVNLKKGDESEV